MTAESHKKSIAKTVSWRVVGSIDTFGVGLLITGAAVAASTIAVFEVFTKLFLFYVHERCWCKAPKTHKHTAAKAVSWRVLAGADTMLIGFIVTGSGVAALSIAGTEVITKFFLFYAHERAWIVLPVYVLKWTGYEMPEQAEAEAH